MGDSVFSEAELQHSTYNNYPGGKKKNCIIDYLVGKSREELRRDSLARLSLMWKNWDLAYADSRDELPSLVLCNVIYKERMEKIITNLY